MRLNFSDESTAVWRDECRLDDAETGIRNSEKLTGVGKGETEVCYGKSWKVLVIKRNVFCLNECERRVVQGAG